MQYKIPVQIENADPIFLWLSWKQLAIVAVWWMWAFKLFQKLSETTPPIIASIPAVIILWIALALALFNKDWMTFFTYILSLIRMNVNLRERFWIMWTDSFDPLTLWYITNSNDKKDEQVDFSEKLEKIKNIDQSLDKI